MGTGAQTSIAFVRGGEAVLDSPRVDALKLRFDDNGTELPLGPGMHGIGRGGDDAIGLVIDPQAPLLRFCVDRRGVWLAVADGVRGIHVNGRPVRRMASTSSPARAAAWAVIGFASAVAMTLSVAGTALAQPLAIIGRIPRTQIRILHPFPSRALPLEAIHFRRLTGIPPASIPDRPQDGA